MTFASTKTLVVLTILWAVALFAVDYAKNPKAAEQMWTSKHMGESAKDGNPVIKLWMNHLCCTGCLTDVTKALEKVSSVKVKQKELASQESADMEAVDKAKDYGNEVDSRSPTSRPSISWRSTARSAMRASSPTAWS